MDKQDIQAQSNCSPPEISADCAHVHTMNKGLALQALPSQGTNGI